MNIYGQKAVDNLIEKYNQHDNAQTWVISGSLLDNYIITADGCKTTIIREKFLNEWSSAYSIIMYNKLPQKYAKIIELLENGETDQAEKLFFN